MTQTSMAYPSYFSYHESQNFSLVRLGLLVLSNQGGTMDMHCAISSDTAGKKKRITASTGKRDHRHVISNLNSMVVELADGECIPNLPFLYDRSASNRK